ncbi:MAG: hypothetical protein J7604_16320 [Sporocytophaga sp.]|uniref:hypothetical protein n=1 Tax=Sporocytophaga sp. TaxID=2231183 RepID=UPI001B04D67E|nr:hypothetical protein [Sporocytophaga sp.]MBO9701773.1 hypothetical protein [Sporocytophaga sp.]
MKIFQIISWTIFVIGVLFKLFHISGSSALLALSCLLLFIHSIIYLIQKLKTDLPISFLNLSLSLWAIYFLFRIQYWSVGIDIAGYKIMVLIPILSSIICLVLHTTKEVQVRFPQIVLFVCFAFSLVLSYTPSYKIYYIVNLNTILNEETRKTNYFAWDKYSWFLYISNQLEDAKVANDKAQQALDEYLMSNNDTEAVQYSEKIKQHKANISSKNWVEFP